MGGSVSPRRSKSTALGGQKSMKVERKTLKWAVIMNYEILIGMYCIPFICSFTHPRSSFWLRSKQVSWKQAILPRMPTHISYKTTESDHHIFSYFMPLKLKCLSIHKRVILQQYFQTYWEACYDTHRNYMHNPKALIRSLSSHYTHSSFHSLGKDLNKILQ